MPKEGTMAFLGRTTIVVTVSLLLVAAALLGAGPALAQGPGNDLCLSCHAQPGMQTTLPSGETLYLTVDRKCSTPGTVSLAGLLHCHVKWKPIPTHH
jgi:hypothetical protein